MEEISERPLGRCMSRIVLPDECEEIVGWSSSEDGDTAAATAVAAVGSDDDDGVDGADGVDNADGEADMDAGAARVAVGGSDV